MENKNLSLMKSGRKERLISLNKQDLEVIYSWLDNYEKINPLALIQDKDTIDFLETRGPITPQRCEIIILSHHLEKIHQWFKYLKNKTDLDNQVFNIIDSSLNPK